ncbi:uncharacterized protein [Typha latifolia]|uniref:uncharacterized protein isoform X1 n=2 Tax=Typha latifolia TaxID=4733 RepID=UPI003C306220
MSMGNPSNERPDDLEITSIGALYHGHWDKKYWSCSRGKDRYPYPIGYHAIRTHAGNTYKIEVREGIKGPLFVVTSTNGHSSTGQTPDIAWENFQKKSGPKVKNCHGRRLSSKIDGVELFGFKNPLVQRLLRELMADVKEAAERNLLSLNITDSSQLNNKVETQSSNACFDLPACLGKQQSTRKRSMKHQMKEGRTKRIERQDIPDCKEGDIAEQSVRTYSRAKDKSREKFKEKHLSDALPTHGIADHLSYSTGRSNSIAAVSNETSCKPGCHFQNDAKDIKFVSSTNNYLVKEDSRNSSRQVYPLDGESYLPLLAREELPAKMDCGDCVIEKHVISLEESKHINDSRFSYMESKACNAENMLLWEQEEMKNDHVIKESTFVADPCDSDALPGSIPKELIDIHNQCTLECMHPMPDGISYLVKCTPDNGSSRVIKDSLPEVNPSPGSSNPSSERTDSDSTGQELAKSMMAFLLPQAVPLLKKTYIKRKSRHRNREADPKYCSILTRTNCTEKVENDRISDDICGGNLEVKMLAQRSTENISEKGLDSWTLLHANSQCKMTKVKRPINDSMKSRPFTDISKEAKSVIPDSFEDDPYVCDVTMKKPSPSDHSEANYGHFNETNLNADSSKSPFSRKGGKEHSSCLLESNDIDGVVMLQNELEKDDIMLSDSLLACLEEEFKEKSTVEEDKVSCPAYQGADCVDHMLALNSASVVHDVSQHFNNTTNDFIPITVHLSNHGPSGTDLADDCSQDSLQSPTKLKDTDVSVIKTEKSHSGNNHGCSIQHELIYYDVQTLPESRDSYGQNIEGPTGSLQARPHPKEAANATGDSSSFYTQNTVAQTEVFLPNNERGDKFLHANNSSRNYDILLSESIICRNFDDADLEKYAIPNTSNKEENGGSGCKKDNAEIRISAARDIENNEHNPLLEKLKNTCASESALYDPAHSVSQDLVKNATEDIQARVVNDNAEMRMVAVSEVKPDEGMPSGSKLESISASEFNISVPSYAGHQDMVKNVAQSVKVFNSNIHSHSYFEKNCLDSVDDIHESQSYCIMQQNRRGMAVLSRKSVLEASSCSNPLTKLMEDKHCKDIFSDKLEKSHMNGLPSPDAEEITELGSPMKLAGCYLHPNHVLSIILSSKEDFLQICVLCGLLEDCNRYLYIYTVPLLEQREKCPSFSAYTTLVLPPRNGLFKGDLQPEQYGLQFTPDGQSLVLLTSIRTPYCRNQSISCLCLMCKTQHCENDGIKIVKTNFGYVSPVTSLRAYEKISCILVCEPNYLIAAELSGKLHGWMMNSGWSSILEEFMLPRFGNISSSIVELKRVSRCRSFVIGHDGIGGFGLWDISKRALLSRFSAPGNTIFQILPVGLGSLRNIDILASNSDIEENLKIMATNCSTEAGGDPFLMLSGEDIAVWLLVSAASASEFQCHFEVKEPVLRCWRLALLAKNKVFMGSILDPRASAMGVSADCGIVGTYEGLLYKWELSTGKKLANIHCFKCGSVSCIAVDAQSGTMAVADNKCQLLIYAQPRTSM